MFKCNRGYVFEARMDCNGKKGIKESIDIFNGKATIICGIGVTGEILKGVYYTANDGFIPLRDSFADKDAILKFLKSNRATYAVIGQAHFMAKIVYNIKTKEAKITVYIPVSDVRIDSKDLGVAYYRMSTEAGMHLFKVSEKAYTMLTDTIKSQLDKFNFDSKADYLVSRL